MAGQFPRFNDRLPMFAPSFGRYSKMLNISVFSSFDSKLTMAARRTLLKSYSHRTSAPPALRLSRQAVFAHSTCFSRTRAQTRASEREAHFSPAKWRRQYTTSASAGFGNQVSITLDGSVVEFDSIFLRDACQCPSCVDKSTSQKNFQTSDVPIDIQGAFVEIGQHAGTDAAVIRWANDLASEHKSIVPLSVLRNKGDDRRSRRIAHFNPSNLALWDRASMANDNVFLEFNDFLSSEKVLLRAMRQLESHGLVFLRNVPDCTGTDSSASLNQIVSRIGPIRSTFYGLTWDVKSVPGAINVAYTHQFLGLHMDLCYMDLTPQFQFLHSLRARAPGGESIFSDSFRAADRMRSEHPDDFRALTEFPVTFHYYNAGQSYRQVRPTIELVDQTNASSPIKTINWSPPFQGPLTFNTMAGGASLRSFLAAAKQFNNLISAPESLFELRMSEGDCAIFDNRRVLHARRAFDISKGERWLKGAYLDRDVFASRLARLEESVALEKRQQGTQ
jgi:alpha-ketoglutarate-dependent taurine dioxygenase